MTTKRIGIYGGAFNPIHYGHLRTAEEVLEIFSLDSMIFMPSGITPFDKPDLLKAEHRYKMVKFAIDDNPRFRISKIEVNRRTRSYTVDTFRKLREKYRKSELFFVLGIDAFLDLPCWKQPDMLADLTNLVVISRPGYRFSELSSSPYLKGVSAKVLKELDKGSRGMIDFDISDMMKGYLCNVTGLNISASGVRRLVSSGKNINYLLPDSVKSYIISNKFYG